ncbi:ExeA family protein [Desulfocurvus sp. DL9XJH121]
MNYFDVLDLRAEPFSNTPDPDFLYRSSGHEGCLHTLEISLRLRRGLCVVLGEVGTGKTTLCRELLRILSEDGAVTAHLVLDPGFSSPREMLTTLHSLLYRERGAAALSDWQLKEDIKHALFEYGADQDRLLCLIIDEGQKLTPPCLEVLRELLNYETNDRKLLQIVIFAQTEFRESLEAMPNLRDRVNDIISLGPLSFKETVAMVRHRLDRAKAGYGTPELFTSLGYRALYRLTGGYPRRIVRLGHKVILSLILSQRRKASWGLVRACSRREEAGPEPNGARLAPAALLVLLCVLGMLVWPAPLQLPPWPAHTHRAEAVQPGEAARTSGRQARFMPSPTPAARETAPAAATAPPPILGQVRIHAGENISHLTRVVYGSFNRSTLETVLDANPALENPDRIEAGDTIRFSSRGMAFQLSWWVPLAEAGTLAEAVTQWRARRPRGDAKILACKDGEDGLRFVLTAGGGHETRAEAAAHGDEDPASGWALACTDAAPARAAGPWRGSGQATTPRTPEMLGEVDMRPDEDLPTLAGVVYGDASPRTLAALRKANPGLTPSGRTGAEDVLRFPLAGLAFREAWWVPLAEARTLAGAMALWRAAPFLPEARILAWWSHGHGLRFAVTAGAPCATEEQAGSEARALGVTILPRGGQALVFADGPRTEEHAAVRRGGAKEQQ